MKTSKYVPLVLMGLSSAMPLFALAQDGDIFTRIIYLVNASILTLIGIATLVFLYGVLMYVIAQGDTTKMSAGKTYIVWGLIGLTVMVSVWGFVNLIVFTVFGDEGPSNQPDFGLPVSPGSGTGTRNQVCVAGICVAW